MALCSERPFPALHGAVGTPGRCETLGHAILQRPNPSLRRRPPYFCPVLLLVQTRGEYLGARYPSPKKEIRQWQGGSIQWADLLFRSVSELLTAIRNPPPRHLERRVRRLYACPASCPQSFRAGRPVRACRSASLFPSASPGPRFGSFGGCSFGSQYAPSKLSGEGLLYKGLSNPSLWQLVIANPLVATAPRSDRPHGRLPQKFALPLICPDDSKRPPMG